MSKKLSKEDIVERARAIHGDKYDYSLFLDDNFTFNGVREDMPIICPKHGVFNMSISSHINGGRGCRKCANDKMSTERTMPFEEFERLSNKRHNGKYTYDKSTYKSASVRTRIICPKHGEFWQLPVKHYLLGQGCRMCYEEMMHDMATTNLSSEEFYEKANSVHNGRYKYTGDFTKTKDPITVICPIHGEFTQEAESHLQGHGCKKCSNVVSKDENEIYEYVCQLVGKENIIKGNRTILEGKEIDIFIPSLNIGIEYNGIIWHSSKFGKDCRYHLRKLVECNKNGIKLIQVFEDEWIEHRDIVLKKIKHILGFNDGEKVYARKCDVKEIDKHIGCDFLNKNHIQGSVGSSVFLGAYYNEKLVGVMSFKEESKNHWNLTRFATDNDLRCIGIAGKLFSSFLKTYNPTSVKSFADRRWTISEENNVYTQLGFELTDVLKPDYRYVNGHKREHKFGYRKDKLHKKYGVPLEWTEKQMTEHLGFYRIYDCGLLRYEWKKE